MALCFSLDCNLAAFGTNYLEQASYTLSKGWGGAGQERSQFSLSKQRGRLIMTERRAWGSTVSTMAECMGEFNEFERGRTKAVQQFGPDGR